MVFFIFYVIGVSGCLIFINYFFRQPSRVIPGNKNLFVSPANGKVIAIRPFDTQFYTEPKYDTSGAVEIWTKEVGASGTVISIALSITDVHYQRAPIDSLVISNTYTPGRFENAMNYSKDNYAKAQNEHTEILLLAAGGKFKYKIVQIAGFIARKIETYVNSGDAVAQGDVIGLIKFGSQVTVVLPAGIEVLVKEDDVLVDGETILAFV